MNLLRKKASLLAENQTIDFVGDMDMSTLFDYQNPESSSRADTRALETPEILSPRPREHSTTLHDTAVGLAAAIPDLQDESSTPSEALPFNVPGLRRSTATSSDSGFTPESAHSFVTNPYAESEKPLFNAQCQVIEKHLSNESVEEYSAGVVYIGGRRTPTQLSKRRLKELEHLKEFSGSHMDSANGSPDPLSLLQPSYSNMILGYSKVVPSAPSVRTSSNPLCCTPPIFWVKTSAVLGNDDPWVPDPAQPAVHSLTFSNSDVPASGEAAIMQSNRRSSVADSLKAFENTSTSVAASQMRNALNNLADTVEDPKEKKLFETEMDNFFALFRRYLNDKAKGNAVDWERIQPPGKNLVVDYNELANSESVSFLSKLAVLKLNGGLGTSMGCVGPKSVIEVRDGMSFLDLSVRQIEYLNRTYNVNVPFVLMNSFNTDDDTQNIIKKYEGHNIDILTFNQSRYPRILKDSLLPAPKTFNSPISDWYPPGHGDVFESLYNSGILDKLIERGVEILFLSNVDNLGAVVDLRVLQHMVESEAEYIMELTDKTKADVKGGTIIDYEGSVRLLEIAQVPKEHTNEFKSIKKFKYFNTNNIWLNLKAVKRIVENNELEMEIIPNNKSIPADKKGESDVSIVQLETAVGAAIRHFKNAHGVNVPRRRFLPVKTCSDLMLVKSDLYSLKHGQLQIDPNRFGPAPLIKLGNDFKKVSDFQKRISSIPKIIELDHLTITGAVNLGRGVTLKGTVIIVATEGSTIDIPPGSILENVVVQGSLRLLEH